MFLSDLLSTRQWCDLVFEGRNKEYGAYRLRSGLGRRQRFGVILVYVAVLALTIIPILANLYMRYTLVRGSIEEMETIVKLKRMEGEDNHEVKAVAQGRHLPARQDPGETTQTPDVVEERQADEKTFGSDEMVPIEVVEQNTDDPPVADSLLQNDPLAPVIGKELTATEVVEQMPHFPGGPGALMKWLDQNVPYPAHCIEKKIKGDVRVSFLIDKTGAVCNPEISRSAHHDLDTAVLAAIKRMPSWKPGRVGGRASIVRVTIPVHFE